MGWATGTGKIHNRTNWGRETVICGFLFSRKIIQNKRNNLCIFCMKHQSIHKKLSGMYKSRGMKNFRFHLLNISVQKKKKENLHYHIALSAQLPSSSNMIQNEKRNVIIISEYRTARLFFNRMQTFSLHTYQQWFT